MDFFDLLLAKKHKDFKDCLPLWRLKLTDTEYADLKSTLQKAASSYTPTPFTNLKEECALYFAEWWRREYAGGKPSVSGILETLSKRADLEDHFYATAQKGGECLGIQVIQIINNHPLETLLYQGGLPIYRITSAEMAGNWNTFAKGLLKGRKDIDQLNLGDIASKSKSIEEFCNWMKNAVDSENYLCMPFNCANADDPTFQNLLRIKKQESRRQSQLRPFSIGWEIRIDQIEKQLHVNYMFKGPCKLPEKYMNHEGLDANGVEHIWLYVNGKQTASFDYFGSLCNYEVAYTDKYCNGDQIALIANGHEEPLLSDNFDLSTPHLLFLNPNGRYYLENKKDYERAAIVYGVDWKIVGGIAEVSDDIYTWQGEEYKVALLSEEDDGAIELERDGERLLLGVNTTNYWTEVKAKPITHPLIIKDTLIDASKMKVFLAHQSGNERTEHQCSALYRSKRGKWGNKLEHGKIEVKAEDPTQTYVMKTDVINIGGSDALHINCENIGRDLKLHISWDYGEAMCLVGTLRANYWFISREDCKDNVIPVRLTPHDNNNNHFTINLRAPFSEFAILDPQSRPINPVIIDTEEQGDENKAQSRRRTRSNPVIPVIPFAELDRYEYRMINRSIFEYAYGDKKLNLKSRNGQLLMCDSDPGVSDEMIPEYGSLSGLLNGRGGVIQLMDRMGMSPTAGTIAVSMQETRNSDPLRFTIASYKYAIKGTGNGFKIHECYSNTNEEGKLIVFFDKKCVAPYKDNVLLINLDYPEMAPVILAPIEPGVFELPAEVLPWERIFVAGERPGILKCKLLQPNVILQGNEHREYVENAELHVKEEIRNANFASAYMERAIMWFKRCYGWERGDSSDSVEALQIPGSSIMDLRYMRVSPLTMLKFLLRLFMESPTDAYREQLSEKLRRYANDVTVQWHWLLPYVRNIKNAYATLEPHLTGVNKWPLACWMLDEDENLSSFDCRDEAKLREGLANLLEKFEEWTVNLCISSLTETYGATDYNTAENIVHYIVYGKTFRLAKVFQEMWIDARDKADEKTLNFYKDYEPGRGSVNEIWFHARVKALVKHLLVDSSLMFNAKEGARRSMIYCSRSNNIAFLRELSIKLQNN